jgi:hypothetical protein
MRSECYCSIGKVGFSCEPSLQPDQRFRFVKEDNCITDRITLDGIVYKGGITENDISNCELKPRVTYKDKQGIHEPDEKKLTGHDLRSIANDHRSGKSHGQHFHQK